MSEQKLKITVLTGGPSSEHEVSLRTAEMIVGSLNASRYDVQKLIIAKTGEWPVPVDKLDADVVFIAMHGEYGEDGVIQGVLEKRGLPYTGSDSIASVLGMDKPKSSLLFRNHGLLVPDFVMMQSSERSNNATFGFPVVVKPANRGSSVGITIVKTPQNLSEALEEALRYSGSVMMQRYIAGREVTCGVLDDGRGNIIALQPTEIIPVSKEFFDYEAKYTPGATKEITPPALSAGLIEQIRGIAVKAHKIVGCSGMSRTDMIIENINAGIEDAKIYVLEINTIPGMTETSLLPQAAQAVGITFPKLLDKIIEAALNRKNS